MKPEPKPKRTEADLAGTIVRYFQNLQWTVYQEVQINQGSSRADIVITQGKLVGIVECKQAMGLPVLEQAYDWLPYAHFVWAATWRGGSRLTERILKDYGIGHLSVDKFYWTEDSEPREGPAPRFCRKPPSLELLTPRLTAEHLQHPVVAGTNRGGHWTPFRSTCAEIERIAKEKPGITLKEALDSFKHHYANTRSALCNLPEWIDKGKVAGVRIDRSDGKLRLVLDSTVCGASPSV